MENSKENKTKKIMMVNNSENEESELEENGILITLLHDGTVYEYESAFISGILKDSDKDEISTIIKGFYDINDFLSIFNNNIFQTISLLRTNVDNSLEEIIAVLRESTDLIFEGTLAGQFEDYYNGDKDIE